MSSDLDLSKKQETINLFGRSAIFLSSQSPLHEGTFAFSATIEGIGRDQDVEIHNFTKVLVIGTPTNAFHKTKGWPLNVVKVMTLVSREMMYIRCDCLVFE